jgi:hypothetical protein
MLPYKSTRTIVISLAGFFEKDSDAIFCCYGRKLVRILRSWQSIFSLNAMLLLTRKN